MIADQANPFHSGEIRAQKRAGGNNVADWAANFIRPFMPDQHREFFSQLPFLVLAGADADGRHWVTLMDGPDGFISSPNAQSLAIDTAPDPQDPLFGRLTGGGDIGLLGIEMATRRRNRMNGRVLSDGSILTINVAQSFGNCPQYIHERKWRRAGATKPKDAIHSSELSAAQMALIRNADTMFIGSGQRQDGDHPSNGFDASHRGGEPGFVAVMQADRLRIPDYAGNNFFNTIGNLLENPRIGLVFVDFATGGLLHVSGRARIDWEAKESHDQDALRMIEVAIDGVVERQEALSLRWSKDDDDLRQLVLVAKMREAADIASFQFAAEDGLPLAPFKAGQYLPIEIDILGHSGPVRRSYSLSGSPDGTTYRLSIKRKSKGNASRFMHDMLAMGDRILAREPAGDFVIPCSNCPLILVSAGVGMTPVLAMLHQVAKDAERPVWYVHGARNGTAHAHREEVAKLTKERKLVKAITYYSQPESNDILGQHYAARGRVTAQMLLDLNAGEGTHYMVCGPAAFLADIRNGLEAAGVAPSQIHIETFGPSS